LIQKRGHAGAVRLTYITRFGALRQHAKVHQDENPDRGSQARLLAIAIHTGGQRMDRLLLACSYGREGIPHRRLKPQTGPPLANHQVFTNQGSHGILIGERSKTRHHYILQNSIRLQEDRSL
jgi:hypothetical protein